MNRWRVKVFNRTGKICPSFPPEIFFSSYVALVYRFSGPPFFRLLALGFNSKKKRNLKNMLPLSRAWETTLQSNFDRDELSTSSSLISCRSTHRNQRVQTNRLGIRSSVMRQQDFVKITQLRRCPLSSYFVMANEHVAWSDPSWKEYTLNMTPPRAKITCLRFLSHAGRSMRSFFSRTYWYNTQTRPKLISRST